MTTKLPYTITLARNAVSIDIAPIFIGGFLILTTIFTLIGGIISYVISEEPNKNTFLKGMRNGFFALLIFIALFFFWILLIQMNS